ncbi:PH domain-containing protein [Sinomonas notoginsengisoli]|uniref:PH domain-containing protein n=1 Tax=Sinomonas notoginsengisoli TaxID=1457311 RepID=UPI001F3D8BF1|nr:PH domain-containing protein [Sinomonas notoginsengisoli]
MTPLQPAAPGRGPAEGAHDAAWQRVHPLSPWVRGWILLLALFVGVGRDWLQSILTGEPMRGWWSDVPVPVLGWAGAAVILIVGGGFVLSWWTTRYLVDETMVRVDTGILFRQHRQARLDRVQAVDVVQPFLARVFGLAELRFEVADAHENALRLAFLPEAEAQRLRASVLAAAATAAMAVGGAKASTAHAEAGRPGEGTPSSVPAGSGETGSPETLVARAPVARILASTALTPFVIVAAVVGALGILLEVSTGLRGLGAAIIPALLGGAFSAWNRVSAFWDFRVLAVGDGVRLSRGLLEARSQTVPAARVQAILIRQPLLWRPFGWWSVHVNVAGYRHTSEREGSKSTLLPVGTSEDVFRVLGLVFPDPGTDPGTGRGVIAAGLTGTGEWCGFVGSPPPARWLDPLAWRRTGYLATRTALLCRTGAASRRLVIVPHERTQSISLTQGPLERRLGLAGVELHSTPGPVRPAVPHLAVAAAEDLFAEQAARAARARRQARPAAGLPAGEHPVAEKPIPGGAA